MQDSDLDALIDALAPVLGLDVDPEWRPAIRTHLAITLRHAAALSAFPLSDDLDPAPVFAA